MIRHLLIRATYYIHLMINVAPHFGRLNHHWDCFKELLSCFSDLAIKFVHKYQGELKKQFPSMFFV